MASHFFKTSILLAGFLVSTAIYAKNPCAEDRQKFCGDVKPGSGRMRECMKAHKDELSPACKNAWEKRKAAHAAKRHKLQEERK